MYNCLKVVFTLTLKPVGILAKKQTKFFEKPSDFVDLLFPFYKGQGFGKLGGTGTVE